MTLQLNLRTKTVMIIGTSLIIMILAVYSAAHMILLDGFARLEQQAVERNLQRATNALANNIERLDALNRDWAAWDDTYAFVRDTNDEFIESNLVDSTFSMQGLNFIAFFDTEGRTVWASGYDLDADSPLPVAKEVLAIFTVPELLAGPETETGRAGVVRLPAGFAAISVQPILTSDETGPARGTMIMAYYLRDAVAAELSDTIQVQTNFLDPAQLRDDVANPYWDAISALNQGNALVVQPLNDQWVAGFTYIEDIFGLPTLLLQVDLPREIYRQRESTRNYLLGSIIIMGLGTLLIMMVLTERLVLARLTSLGHAVRKIHTTNNLTLPIPLSGSDEITQLARDVQGLLTTIRDYQKNLQTINEDLDYRVRMRTAELVEARDEAVEALRLKSQILANISHDARTPLNVITLNTQLIERYTDLTGQQVVWVQHITTSAQQLVSFFDNLIEEARGSAGRLNLRHAPFKPAALAKEVSDNLCSLAEYKGLQLLTQVEPEVPASLVGDPLYLKQILTNLINNAIKFTEQGTISVRFFRPDAAHWAIEVQDTGRGIAPEDQAHIFDAFWQVDGSMTRDVNRGVGLGLSIVRQLTTLMEGQVSMHSSPGTGSTFTVTLPILTNLQPIAKNHASTYSTH